MKWILISWAIACGPPDHIEHLGPCIVGEAPDVLILDSEPICRIHADAINKYWNLKAKCVPVQ